MSYYPDDMSRYDAHPDSPAFAGYPGEDVFDPRSELINEGLYMVKSSGETRPMLWIEGNTPEEGRFYAFGFDDDGLEYDEQITVFYLIDEDAVKEKWPY
jgi:hypothetical protein